MNGFRFNVGDKAKLDNFAVIVVERTEEYGKLYYYVKHAKFDSLTRCVEEKKLERIEGNEEELN